MFRVHFLTQEDIITLPANFFTFLPAMSLILFAVFYSKQQVISTAICNVL